VSHAVSKNHGFFISETVASKRSAVVMDKLTGIQQITATRIRVTNLMIDLPRGYISTDVEAAVWRLNRTAELKFGIEKKPQLVQSLTL
jgi:hypothetical protein